MAINYCKKYSVSLQSLKGLAAIIVFMGHALGMYHNEYVASYKSTAFNILSDGQCSVAIFFCLTGFFSYREHPEITLDVVGLYDNAFKKKIDSRLAEQNIEDSVTFEGRLISHEAVMSQIKKARFALVPVKTDLICSTMREAMAKGLPLVTTITPDTPSLNKDRESVLISSIGDAEAMADNMNKLIEDPDFAAQLRENALHSYRERYSNWAEIQKWVECYKLCVENHKNGTPIPDEYILNC